MNWKQGFFGATGLATILVACPSSIVPMPILEVGLTVSGSISGYTKGKEQFIKVVNLLEPSAKITEATIDSSGSFVIQLPKEVTQGLTVFPSSKCGNLGTFAVSPPETKLAFAQYEVYDDKNLSLKFGDLYFANLTFYKPIPYPYNAARVVEIYADRPASIDSCGIYLQVLGKGWNQFRYTLDFDSKGNATFGVQPFTTTDSTLRWEILSSPKPTGDTVRFAESTLRPASDSK
jgi:hypothetical protein